MPSALDPQNWAFSGLPYLIDGGGQVITVGEWPGFYVPATRIIRGWHLFGPTTETGSINLSLKAAPYASYPAVTEILTPSIAGGNKNSSTDMSAIPLSVSLEAGTFVAVFVTSVTTFTWVSLHLDLVEVA